MPSRFYIPVNCFAQTSFSKEFTAIYTDVILRSEATKNLDKIIKNME